MEANTAEPHVRDCMGRTVQVGDAVGVFPDPKEEYPYEDPNEYEVVEVLADNRAILYDGREVAGKLMQLRFCRPDACDAIISERNLLEKANRSNADAQHELGLLYLPLYWRDDEGDLQRFDSCAWFERAAMQGHLDAQFEYSFCFDQGIVEEAPSSVKWLTLAGENGHAEACMELALYYADFGADEQQALYWYRKARGFGAPHRVSNLLIFAGADKPLPYNYVARLRKSALRSDRNAQYELAKLYATGVLPWEVALSAPTAYAWASIASGHVREFPKADEFEHPLEHMRDKGEPKRLARLLANILNDAEIEEAENEFKEISEQIDKVASRRSHSFPRLWARGGR